VVVKLTKHFLIIEGIVPVGKGRNAKKFVKKVGVEQLLNKKTTINLSRQGLYELVDLIYEAAYHEGASNPYC
jgi:hypothetical protein